MELKLINKLVSSQINESGFFFSLPNPIAFQKGTRKLSLHNKIIAWSEKKDFYKKAFEGSIKILMRIIFLSKMFTIFIKHGIY